MFVRSLAAFVLATGVLAGMNGASATPVTKLSIDGTVFSDPSGIYNEVVRSGAFKGSTILGSGLPFAGAPNEPQIDIGGTIKVSAKGTLVVKMTETGLTSLLDVWDFDSEFSATIKTAGLTMTYETYIDPSDAAFGTTTLLTSSQPFAATGSLSDVQQKTITAPFSFTEILTFVSSKKSNLVSSFDASLSATPVPEPMTVSLLVTGFLGLAAARRRRG